MTGVSLPSESTLWINHIVGSFWRIRPTRSLDSFHENDYPLFVSRGFPQEAERTRSYGGLEPYIASAIGAGLVKSLELTKAMTPTSVAYVSLFSLSLGGRPPILRNLKFGEISSKGDSTKMELEFDLDAVLEDMSIVLGKDALVVSLFHGLRYCPLF